jgi:hypothetical protein
MVQNVPWGCTCAFLAPLFSNQAHTRRSKTHQTASPAQRLARYCPRVPTRGLDPTRPGARNWHPVLRIWSYHAALNWLAQYGAALQLTAGLARQRGGFACRACRIVCAALTGVVPGWWAAYCRPHHHHGNILREYGKTNGESQHIDAKIGHVVTQHHVGKTVSAITNMP